MTEFGTAVILCGGKSQRMGFDKSSIRVNNKYLIEIIGEKLEEIFNEVLLVANDVSKFNYLKYDVIKDELPNLGPVGAIYTSLKRSSSKYVFVVPCDMPFINLDYIRYMMSKAKASNYEGVATCHANFIEPLYAFYSKETIPVFEEHIRSNKLRLHELIKYCNLYYVEEEKAREYSKNLDMFINLNYSSELSALKKLYSEDSEDHVLCEKSLY